MDVASSFQSCASIRRDITELIPSHPSFLRQNLPSVLSVGLSFAGRSAICASPPGYCEANQEIRQFTVGSTPVGCVERRG